MKAWPKVLCVLGVLIWGSCTSPSSSDPSGNQNEETSSQPKSSPSVKENAIRGEIYIAVDESVKPLVEAEINNFMAIHPEAVIHPIYLPGEEAVARMIESDSIRLVITSRMLTEAEDAALRQRLIDPDYALLALDGIAIFTPESNPVNRLSFNQLQSILSGQLTQWQAISPYAPQGEIQLVFDHPQSGVVRYLRDSVLGEKALTQQNVFAQQSTPEMLRYVAGNPRAMGLGGVNWVSDRDDPDTDSLMQGLKVLALSTANKPKSCVEPSNSFGPYQSYLFQRCYPLTRQLRSIRRESIYGLGAGFTAYVVGPRGQRIIHKSGLAAKEGIPRRVRFPPKENSRRIQ